MRDAESMLDQLLSSGADRLDAGQVRDLLGLADAQVLDRFVEALAGGDALDGIRILDDLEDRGRDLRVFLDQVVDALRTVLVARLTSPTGTSTAAIAALMSAASRLGGIDPTRSGPGGLRLQLELALLASPRDASPEKPVPVEVRTPDLPPPPEPAPQPSLDPTPAPVAAAETTAMPAPVREPEPETEPAPSTPAPPADPASSGLEELQRRWPEVVAHISQHPPTKPLIAACRPISVEGDIVTLGFPEGQAFLKDVAERRRQILEDGVSRFLGRPVGVRCVATNLELAPPMPGDEEAERLLTEARRIFAEDLVDVGEVS
jgi:hypothetical protein